MLEKETVRVCSDDGGLCSGEALAGGGGYEWLSTEGPVNRALAVVKGRCSRRERVGEGGAVDSLLR